MPARAHRAIRWFTAGLLLLSLAMTAKGLRQAWVLDGDMDMQTRVAEYAVFRQGVYPTRRLEPDYPVDLDMPHTVYPPYALTMFAVFFEPFGKVQGRIIIELLSLVSLIAIGGYGYRLLRDAGPAAAGLGGVAAWAISGNGNALALSQFSILCAGALLMQITALERGRPLAAGAWWALAMLKPQIGLAFAGLFLARRKWRGLLFGLGILGALSLIACWWTEVPPLAVIDFWLFRMNMLFASETSLAGRLSEALGVSPRMLHVAAGGVMLAAIALLMAREPRRIDFGAEPLFQGGTASLVGGVLLYHLFYDNAMMFPLLFSIFAVAGRRPTAGRLAIALCMGLSLWVPQQLIDLCPLPWLIRPSAWVACYLATIAVTAGDRVTQTTGSDAVVPEAADSSPAPVTGDAGSGWHGGAADHPRRTNAERTTAPNATDA